MNSKLSMCLKTIHLHFNKNKIVLLSLLECKILAQTDTYIIIPSRHIKCSSHQSALCYDPSTKIYVVSLPFTTVRDTTCTANGPALTGHACVQHLSEGLPCPCVVLKMIFITNKLITRPSMSISMKHIVKTQPNINLT